MRFVCGYLLALPFCLGANHALHASDASLLECAELPAPDRAACLDAWLDDRALVPSDLAEVDALVARAPLLALELVDRAGKAAFDPPLAADLLERRGSLLLALGRQDEAVLGYTAALDLDDGVSRLNWISADGSPDWSVELDAGSGRLERIARGLAAAGRPEAQPLVARLLSLGGIDRAGELARLVGPGPMPVLASAPSGLESGPTLPDADVAILAGGSVPLRQRAGRALILSFWASWCQPCMVELPRLQQLYEKTRDRDQLDIVAVNVQEPEVTALAFARKLGLSLPVGRYDSVLDEAFEVRSLPTVIVADGKGRIRARWNGYGPELADTIDELATALIEGPSKQEKELAGVVLGGDSLRVVWTVRLSAAVDGLASAVTVEGTRILVVAGRDLVKLDELGSVIGRQAAPRGAGLLRIADLDGDGVAEWITFRPGGSRVVALGSDGAILRSWESGAPVLDVLPLSAAGPEAPGSVLLGTVAGLQRAALAREAPLPVSSLGGIRGIAASASFGEPLPVLEASGRLCWLDAELANPRCLEPPGGARGIVTAGSRKAGVGLAGVSLADAVSGRFLAADSAQLAIAISGQLLLLDLRTGQTIYRALWPDIERLAAYPAGNGSDYLVVGSGRSVTLLGSAPLSREARVSDGS